uniref:Uncharacterized protein n=1 Tax=Sphaerodactylus townsendi TaxID=933632 RepID=A0ACB8F863_9SAUR
MLHAGIMEAVVAPLTLLGGPCSSSSLVPAECVDLIGRWPCVASEKFLNMGPASALALSSPLLLDPCSFPNICLWGGLYSVKLFTADWSFSMFLLYDTQKVIKACRDSTTVWCSEV